MRISMLFPLLAALALGWGLPLAAEISPAPLCLADTAPASVPALGSPEQVPAQTCGPCLLEFCPEVGVRCSFSGCGINDCCRYSCVCDETCTNPGTPGNTCRFFIPICGCGNGTAEGEEECDLSDLRGETCISQGFDGGTLSCNGDCTLDKSECTDCGNGVQETGEDCDTFDHGGQTCVSLGFDGGTLACTGGCEFDTSGCHKCGNGVCEGPEDCNTCASDCDSKTTGPPSQRFCCGNGIAEPGEGIGCSVCDGNC